MLLLLCIEQIHLYVPYEGYPEQGTENMSSFFAIWRHYPLVNGVWLLTLIH